MNRSTTLYREQNQDACEKNGILILTNIVQIDTMGKKEVTPLLLTRETDYALRVLRCLSDGEKKSAAHISDYGMIPQQFTYKIIKKLSRAGLVRITRGAEGGCQLSADLSEVSLHDVMTAMENTCFVNACMEPDHLCPWADQNGGCHIHTRLAQIQNRLEDDLRTHSLASLLEEP